MIQVGNILEAQHLVNRRYTEVGLTPLPIPTGERYTTLTVGTPVKGTVTLFREGTYAELIRLAYDGSGSLTTLAALFEGVLEHGEGVTVLYIGVNPRHTRFYERVLGFVREGRISFDYDVNAEVQELSIEVEDIRRMISDPPPGTLYRYFRRP